MTQGYKTRFGDIEFVVMKDRVKERDGYKCSRCGSRVCLIIHHKHRRTDHPEEMLDEDNLITLCESCHKKEHEND